MGTSWCFGTDIPPVRRWHTHIGHGSGYPLSLMLTHVYLPHILWRSQKVLGTLRNFRVDHGLIITWKPPQATNDFCEESPTTFIPNGDTADTSSAGQKFRWTTRRWTKMGLVQHRRRFHHCAWWRASPMVHDELNHKLYQPILTSING